MKVKKKRFSKLFSLLLAMLLLVGMLPTTAFAANWSANEYTAYQTGDEYKYPIAVNDGGTKVLVYCLNAENEFPYYHNYKKLIDAEQTDVNDYSTSSTQKDDLIRTVYNGYPYNASGLQEKYGLSDIQFQCVTQAAIWNYTNPYMISEQYYAYSGEAGSDIILINRAQSYLAWNADGTNYFEWTSAMDNAFSALTSNTDQLAVAPANYKLDIYVSNESYIQNLFTLRKENTSVSFDVTKELVGRDLKEGEFEFELYEVDNPSDKANSSLTLIETQTNAADGKVVFSEIPYYKPGSHTYFIREKQGNDPEITYDDHTYEINVSVGYYTQSGTLSIIVGPMIGSYTFTNTYKQQTVDISGEKSWEDNNNQDGKRPQEITVNLLADGNVVDSKKITAEDDWTYSFDNLPKYEDGKEIVYTISEDEVDGYKTEIDGYNIKNIYNPETIKVEGKKTWDDNNNQDGKRPDEITVNLLANGTVVDSKKITADDDWTYSFDNLPKYEKGTEITYTITEDSVEGYVTTYDGYNIKNSYAPEKTSISVTKVWDDQNDKDGLRPKSIDVQLYANGEKTGDVITLNTDNNWTYTWTNLNKKSEGKEIEYSVKEITEVSGYTKNEGEVKDGKVTITNTHKPTIPSVPDTPQNSHKGTSTQTPKTGDSSNIALWSVLMIASFVGVGLCVYGRKRKFLKK